VSKKVAKSSLVTVRDGNALPVPIIFISFSIRLKTRFHFFKNAAKVQHHITPQEKCAEYGPNVAKIGYLWRNLGFFVAKYRQKPVRDAKFS
jgi:hypothetical protein